MDQTTEPDLNESARDGNDKEAAGQVPLGRTALNHRRRQIAGVLVCGGWGLLEASGLRYGGAWLVPHEGDIAFVPLARIT
jgi:hypothetical protein